METEALRFMEQKYIDMKGGILKSSAILHEIGRNIKDRYHIGYPLEGTSRSVLAQFRTCVHRDIDFKRAVKSYYIADATLIDSVLTFPSHPLLNFDLIMCEIKALAELNHPNIARMFEVYFDNKYIHIVTELCKGRELYDKLYTDGMSLEAAFSTLIQILEAVKYIHASGYVHRALCIENIMFADYEKKKVKIIGFSCCTKVEGRLTERFGSPMYMAPEVFTGNYNEKCDIWSVGVIFFTMVTGHQPFQSIFFNGLVKNITDLNFVKSESWSKAEKPVKKFIEKFLVKKNRPSAEALLNHNLIRKYLNSHNKLAIKQLMRTIKSIRPDSNFSIKVRLSNKLKIATYKILAPMNVLHDLASLERLWSELDSNNAEILLENDIVNNIERVLNKQNMSGKAHQILKKFDLDKRGCICKDEFIGLLCDFSDKSLLMHAFGILDLDGNGTISASDFDAYFHVKGYENLENLICEAYGSTTLTYEDYAVLITKFIAS